VHDSGVPSWVIMLESRKLQLPFRQAVAKIRQRKLRVLEILILSLNFPKMDDF